MTTSLNKKQWICIGSIAGALLLLVMVIVASGCSSGNCGEGGGSILTNHQQLVEANRNRDTPPVSQTLPAPTSPSPPQPVSQPRPQPDLSQYLNQYPQPVPQPRPQPVPQPRPQPVPQPRPQPVPQPVPPPPIPVPDNDTCRQAEAIRFSARTRTNEGASIDSAPRCSRESVRGPGVWFTIDGSSGDRYTAETCSRHTDFDTKITIYRGSCSNLVCVTANDDHDSDTCSEVTWDTESDETYYILVHGRDSGEVGDFNLDIDSSSSPPPPPQPSPTSPSRPSPTSPSRPSPTSPSRPSPTSPSRPSPSSPSRPSPTSPSRPSPTSPSRPTQPTPPTSSTSGSTCHRALSLRPPGIPSARLPLSSSSAEPFSPCYGHSALRDFRGGLAWYKLTVPSFTFAALVVCGNSVMSLSAGLDCGDCVPIKAQIRDGNCHAIGLFVLDLFVIYDIVVYGDVGSEFRIEVAFVFDSDADGGGGGPTFPTSPSRPSLPSPPTSPSFSRPSGVCQGRYIQNNDDCSNDPLLRCASCCQSDSDCQAGLRDSVDE